MHVEQEVNGRVKVRARERTGWVDVSALDGVSLLEIYIIDVGQGDGVLLKTPDAKWHLIDAGVSNERQMTRKGTVNFLRWKFQDALMEETVALTNVLVTHPDADHYGGLIDVLSGSLSDDRTFPVSVENLYHNGLGRFAAEPKLGETVQGQVAPFPYGDHGIDVMGTFVTELLDGADSFRNPPRKLDTYFAKYAELVSRVPKHVRRLTREDGNLPGYGPGENPVTITILGPILENFGNGQTGLRAFEDADSKTVNGQSILMRLDYGQAWLLLTGDLNTPSQRLLLSLLRCRGVRHGCIQGVPSRLGGYLHGFPQSREGAGNRHLSGDNESYSHPRPLVVGASGRCGREPVGVRGEKMPPLVYSTELARSVKLDYPLDARIRRKDGAIKFEGVPVVDVQLKAGDWKQFHSLAKTSVSSDLVYGLVNVRTDGQHILCGTMIEKGSDFDIKVFRAGLDA